MSAREPGHLVIGTRGSALALWQAHHIRDRLLALPGQPVREVELEIIQTQGDRILEVTLSRVGGKGLFVKELEASLLRGDVDLCVHSLKDMPTQVCEGTRLAAYPARADARDAWVRPEGAAPLGLRELPEGAVVATSSLRRQAQLLRIRPDLRIVPVRGNVGTRLSKLDQGDREIDAMVLACAGLKRLDLDHRITAALEPETMLPAVGQGVLAIQCRSGDQGVIGLLGHLDHGPTRTVICAERSFLATLEGGCQVPVAAYATLERGQVVLRGLVASPDGQTILEDRWTGDPTEASSAGEAMAHGLLDRGAAALIEAGRQAQAREVAP